LPCNLVLRERSSNTSNLEFAPQFAAGQQPP